MKVIGTPIDEKIKAAIPILTIELRNEHDIVSARQRMRQIAELAGFDSQDQTRVATAISELSRNAFQYAKRGKVSFLVDVSSEPQALLAKVDDCGPGIPHLKDVFGGNYQSQTGMGVGLAGSRKLMDHFHLRSDGEGTSITIGKNLPKGVHHFDKSKVNKLVADLTQRAPQSPYEELENQNRSLIELLSKLEAREDELQQLNQELAETNRGVVALYAELDQKAETLQKVSEVKTSFLSNMTHEFRTPLNSIISLTRILLDRLDGELTEEQDKQVMFIRKSAASLLELVNDLLDLGKVESGRISMNVSDFTIDDIFGPLRGMFRPILGSGDELILTFDHADADFAFKSDEAKISQVLRNLISNAIKFTEKGEIRVWAEVRARDVLFKVSDTGIGIAPEHLEAVFDDYTQLDSRLQHRSKGTGLGLPLSRKLARLLGGDLWVESAPGKGSEFFARIPLVYRGEKEEEIFGTQSDKRMREPSEKQSRSTSVLVIDDDPASRYILRGALNQELGRCLMTEVETGEDGVRMAEQLKPDVIFLDLNLPGISGVEVLRSIKASERIQSIPVIINTSRLLTDLERSRLLETSLAVLSKDRSDVLKSDEELKTALKNARLI